MIEKICARLKAQGEIVCTGPVARALALIFVGLGSVGCSGGGEPAAPSAAASPSVAAPSASTERAALAQIAYLKASNTGPGDQFGAGGTLLGNGAALSADGRTLAVGATLESSGIGGVDSDQSDDAAYGAGAVYVFTRAGSSWVQQAYIKAAQPGLNDNFGFMVSLSADGNTLAVGAPYESSAATGINGDELDDSIPQAGAAYVFVRDGGAWRQQAYMKASNTGTAAVGDSLSDGDQYGFAVALSGDGRTLAVGAITEDSAATGINGDESDDSAMSAGAVYVYTRDGDSWSQEAYVKPSNTGDGDLFGYSVSLSENGNVLAVGGFDEDGSLAGNNEHQDDDARGSGAVYVFERDNGRWAQRAYLKAANTERNDSLGVVVALSDDGNTLAASALDEDSLTTGVNSTPVPDWQSDTSAGAVYVFVRSGEGWTQQAYLKASNSGREDWFGSRMALSRDGSTLLAGAQLEDSAAQGINGRQDDDSAEEAGAAYLFRRNGTEWSQLAYLKGSNTEAFDEFGSAVALSGDGHLLAIGARAEDSAATGAGGDQSDNSAVDAGAVYLFAD
jgi:FG-GAP repeat